MPEQDLQQWLNSLKKNAAPGGAGRPAQPAADPGFDVVEESSHRYASAHPAPAPQRSAQAPHRPETGGGFLSHPLVREVIAHVQERVEKLQEMQEAMQRPASSAQTAQVTQAASASAEQRLSAKRAAKQNAPVAAKPQPKAGSKPASSSSSSSSLGLSGDLVRDLRTNPAALREAILLVETLGPPLADRDPFERLI